MSKKKPKYDPEAVKRAMDDLANFGSHLLSPEQISQLERHLNEAEDLVLSGEVSNLSDVERIQKALRLDTLLVSWNTPYEAILAPWVGLKAVQMARHTGSALVIKDFYENSPVGTCAAMAPLVELPKAKAFIKEGNEFYVLSLEWPNLAMRIDEKRQSAAVAIQRPVTVEGPREVWTGNYRTLTDRILAEKDYSKLLAKAPEGSDSGTRDIVLTTAFATAYGMVNPQRR